MDSAKPHSFPLQKSPPSISKKTTTTTTSTPTPTTTTKAKRPPKPRKPRSPVTKKASKTSPPLTPKQDKTQKAKERRKEEQPVVLPPAIQDHDSETDTADEKSDLEDGLGESAEAAEALMALAGADVNGRVRSSSSSSSSTSTTSSSSQRTVGSTGEEERSPVLMEHSYCLPWAPKDGTNASFLPPGELLCLCLCLVY
ncbi:hypothetical protein E2C01_002836 [Portunus trituberculatus]|uniref:Uncharacterized protein n=1 Tax=Portunus trituberculatus TaxID=210409 RepID=A0A5B7CP92_PORTR|nr:hypothetical protein [Portunus trituberculatus]